MQKNKHLKLSQHILIAMILGFVIGVIIHWLPNYKTVDNYLVNGVLDIGGRAFINLLKMIVVPIVFVSLVCGTFSLDSSLNVGKIALRTFLLYIFTTALAITLALAVAHFFAIGYGNNTQGLKAPLSPALTPSFKATILNILPSNPIRALAQGNMLQIIIFSLLLGVAIHLSHERGRKVRELFKDLDVVIMHLTSMVLKLSPYGVFCLVAKLFAENGLPLFLHLSNYFLMVITVLLIHVVFVYSSILLYLAKLNPITFFKQMMPGILFAFSTSSSTASIPVVMNTVERKLGVKESIAAFVIPLGATINMDGTAIMQGVATVFIANSYGVNLDMLAYVKIVVVATLASIGTAGIPSIGLITLMMVLLQVGLPVEGIALIIGVDRLLDMARTAVNICGDAMVACVIAVKEKQINLKRFNTLGYVNEEDEENTFI